MAKKTKKINETVTVRFLGGPRGGIEMVVLKSGVPDRMRFAIPDWANYYRRGDSLEFEYRDDVWEPVEFQM